MLISSPDYSRLTHFIIPWLMMTSQHGRNTIYKIDTLLCIFYVDIGVIKVEESLIDWLFIYELKVHCRTDQTNLYCNRNNTVVGFI
jgi:hypothetical protein